MRCDTSARLAAGSQLVSSPNDRRRWLWIKICIALMTSRFSLTLLAVGDEFTGHGERNGTIEYATQHFRQFVLFIKH